MCGMYVFVCLCVCEGGGRKRERTAFGGGGEELVMIQEYLFSTCCLSKFVTCVFTGSSKDFLL